jgi:signal peptidase I
MSEATFHKSTVREYFESIVVAVVLALFIRTFVVQAFKIPTGSMEPNLLVGDHLLVNKFIFAPTASTAERMLLPMRDLRRGDIAVFKFPEEPERDFIKRVIGLPGDTIELKGRQLFVNGVKAEEPYAHYMFPQGEGVRRPRALWSGHGSCRSLLHDGRQSRQLSGQPLLGLSPRALRERPSAHDLLVVRCTRWRTARGSRRHDFLTGQHRDLYAVEPPAASNPLRPVSDRQCRHRVG